MTLKVAKMENFNVVEERVRKIMELYEFEVEPIKLNPRLIISDELDDTVNGYFEFGETPDDDVIILRKDYRFIEAALAHEITHLLQVGREGVEDVGFWCEFEAIAIEEHYRLYHLSKNLDFIRYVDTKLKGQSKPRYLSRLLNSYLSIANEYKEINFTDALISVNKILTK